MKLKLIAAMAKNRVIGNNGDIPWHLPADFAYFRKMTMGHPMLMGRTTLESLPGLLPGRRHIVVTRQASWRREGCEVYHSIEAALHALANEPVVMVIGGSQIYEQTLAMADEVLLTEIDHAFEGDRCFPELPADQWQEISREYYKADEKNKVDFYFVRYTRRYTLDK